MVLLQLVSCLNLFDPHHHHLLISTVPCSAQFCPGVHTSLGRAFGKGLSWMSQLTGSSLLSTRQEAPTGFMPQNTGSIILMLFQIQSLTALVMPCLDVSAAQSTSPRPKQPHGGWGQGPVSAPPGAVPSRPALANGNESTRRSGPARPGQGPFSWRARLQALLPPSFLCCFRFKSLTALMMPCLDVAPPGPAAPVILMLFPIQEIDSSYDALP